MKNKISTRKIAYTGIMTALVFAATVLLGFRTGEFFVNLGDTVIFITAALFGPIPAMIAGGLGSFFADLAVYPGTMFFTLFIKGIEGLICGLLMRVFAKVSSKKSINIILSIVSMIVAGAFMMMSYFMCQMLIYGTYATAIIALPADAVQASMSVLAASVVLYVLGLIKFKSKLNSTNYVPESSSHCQHKEQ